MKWMAMTILFHNLFFSNLIPVIIMIIIIVVIIIIIIVIIVIIIIISMSDLIKQTAVINTFPHKL